jgi:hypothetical protein
MLIDRFLNDERVKDFLKDIVQLAPQLGVRIDLEVQRAPFRGALCGDEFP